jgi:hypothetical protein
MASAALMVEAGRPLLSVSSSMCCDESCRKPRSMRSVGLVGRERAGGCPLDRLPGLRLSGCKHPAGLPHSKEPLPRVPRVRCRRSMITATIITAAMRTVHRATAAARQGTSETVVKSVPTHTTCPEAPDWAKGVDVGCGRTCNVLAQAWAPKRLACPRTSINTALEIMVGFTLATPTTPATLQPYPFEAPHHL